MDQIEPIIHSGGKIEIPETSFSAVGKSTVIHEWMGSGPPYLHVHYRDDEAWHILEGELTFQFIDRQIIVSKGATVFVPAGVAHTYFEHNGPSRYLIILTSRLNDLIAELQKANLSMHGAIMKKYDSEIL